MQTALERLRAAVPTISVGVLSADLMALGEEIGRVKDAGVELLHFDVMDGRFCPSLTFGPAFVKGVKTDLLKDIHLMVEEPIEKLDGFVRAGADMVTVSVESTRHIHRALQMLGRMENANDPDSGIVRGVGLNPGTPVEVLRPLLGELEMVLLLTVNPGWGGQSPTASTPERIAAVREMARDAGRDLLIMLDGGVKKENIAEIAAYGPDIVVTGSAVFDGKAPGENARLMLDTLKGERP